MKKLFYLLLLGIFLISCDNAPTVVNVQIPLDTLYKEAKDLKGIGPIFIGMHVKNIKQINKTTDEYDMNNHPFEIPYDIKYDKKKLHKDLKIYESYSYMIGDFKINSVKLYFYKDTLYKIYTTPFSSDGNIKEAFSVKYNKGITKISVYERRNILAESQSNIWENQNIIAEYVEISPKIPSFISDNARNRWFEKNHKNWFSDSWFTIQTKSKRILDAVKECENNQYSKEKEDELQKKKATIDKI